MCFERSTYPQKQIVHTIRLRKYITLLEGEVVPDNVIDVADRSAARFEVVEQSVDIAKMMLFTGYV